MTSEKGKTMAYKKLPKVRAESLDRLKKVLDTNVMDLVDYVRLEDPIVHRFLGSNFKCYLREANGDSRAPTADLAMACTIYWLLRYEAEAQGEVFPEVTNAAVIDLLSEDTNETSSLLDRLEKDNPVILRLLEESYERTFSDLKGLEEAGTISSERRKYLAVLSIHGSISLYKLLENCFQG